jgi:cytochrome c oxidase subunit 2
MAAHAHDEKTMKQSPINEVIFLILVVLTLIVLPYSIMKYGGILEGAPVHEVNVFGYNPINGEEAYWAVSDKGAWNFDGWNGESVIRVKKGEKVKLKLTTFDNVHGFAIKDLNIDERLYPGTVTEVSFVADKPGEYVYYCSRYCGNINHFKMRGKLIVEE